MKRVLFGSNGKGSELQKSERQKSKVDQKFEKDQNVKSIFIN